MDAITDGWMQTYSGRKFFVADPKPDDIYVQDIAAALSKMCRYGGHCRAFYSVAEHCVLVARHAKPEHKLAALMHDASEAYLVDIPRPIKPIIGNYYAIEDRVMAAIAATYGFAWPLPPEVKELDNRILGDERDQVMAPMDVPGSVWGDALPRLGVEIQCWQPARSESEFLLAFEEYAGRWL